jgi:hypothetical protein
LKKHEALQSAGTILLVWLAALGVIFILPEIPTTQKYLLGFVASILTSVAFPVYFGWEKITGLPRSSLREILFVVQTIFYFYTGYLLWSLVAGLWPVPPVVNGYYVVTWLHLFFVVLLIFGAVIFYVGIINVKQLYLWRRELRRKKRRSKGQSA